MNKQKHTFKNFEWIDITNPKPTDLINLNLNFSIDNNFFEDALEPGHLPKIEKDKDYTFIILRAFTAKEHQKAIEVGQISNKIAFFIHQNGLITIHRNSFDFIDNAPKDLDSADSLLLYLINALVISFEKPIKSQSDKMDELERNIFLHGGNNLSVEKLYFEKSKARLAKKILILMHNVINDLKVNESLATSIQDIKDTIQNLTLRTEEVVEDSNALLNTYMSFTAKKSNDVMKLLTVFSAFFLPLTFIVGVYGMNFENMPELRWQYGYFASIVLMLSISLGIYLWFKKKKIL